MKTYSKSLDEGVELSKKLTKVHTSAAKKTKADKVIKAFTESDYVKDVYKKFSDPKSSTKSKVNEATKVVSKASKAMIALKAALGVGAASAVSYALSRRKKKKKK